ncbi:hypothetical protein TNCV_4254861 [Trichonephila clavipes]|nr:hypothetical protein TNCV_4254861 [Trichonephila clavipes]
MHHIRHWTEDRLRLNYREHFVNPVGTKSNENLPFALTLCFRFLFTGLQMVNFHGSEGELSLHLEIRDFRVVVKAGKPVVRSKLGLVRTMGFVLTGLFCVK